MVTDLQRIWDRERSSGVSRHRGFDPRVSDQFFYRAREEGHPVSRPSVHTTDGSGVPSGGRGQYVPLRTDRVGLGPVPFPTPPPSPCCVLELNANPLLVGPSPRPQGSPSLPRRVLAHRPFLIFDPDVCRGNSNLVRLGQWVNRRPLRTKDPFGTVRQTPDYLRRILGQG